MRRRSECSLRDAPQIVVVQLFLGWRLERVNLAGLRIHFRYNVLDRAIVAGRVHALEKSEERPTGFGRGLCPADPATGQ